MKARISILCLIFSMLLCIFTTSNNGYTAPVNQDVANAKKAEADRKTVVAKSEKPEVYVERGRIFDSMQELDNAIANYNFAIYLNPRLADAYYYRGADWLKQGKVDAAFDDFNKVLELQEKVKAPKFNAYYMRGLCYVEMGKFDLATQDFEAALPQAKDNQAKANIHQKRGAAFLSMKMFPAAKADFDTLLSLAPNNPNGHYYEGRVALEMKKYPEALKHFDMALTLDHKYTFAYFFKGRLLTFFLNNPKGGVDAFTKAIECEPDYASFYLNRGHANLRIGQVANAKKDFAKALALNPNMASHIPTDKQIAEAMKPQGSNIVTAD